LQCCVGVCRASQCEASSSSAGTCRSAWRIWRTNASSIQTWPHETACEPPPSLLLLLLSLLSISISSLFFLPLFSLSLSLLISLDLTLSLPCSQYPSLSLYLNYSLPLFKVKCWCLDAHTHIDMFGGHYFLFITSLPLSRPHSLDLTLSLCLALNLSPSLSLHPTLPIPLILLSRI
jgi:hypothetical protein